MKMNLFCPGGAFAGLALLILGAGLVAGLRLHSAGPPVPAPILPPALTASTVPVLRTAPAVPASVPEQAWSSIRQQIEEEQRRFRPAPDGSLHSYNTQGGERLMLHPDGSATLKLRGEESAPQPTHAANPHLEAIALVAPSGDRPSVALKLKTESLGRGTSQRPLTGLHPAQTAGNQDAARQLSSPEGEITEWWKSRTRGFELGWTIPYRPSGEGLLRVDLSVDSPWPAKVSAGGREVDFRDPAGSGWGLVCSGLLAYDASGRSLPAQMATAAGRLTISVDDTAAAYPLVIDPWLYADRALGLKANDGSAGRRFGARVAACGDVVVAEGKESPGNADYDGEVYILSRAGVGYAVRRKVGQVLIPLPSPQVTAPPFAVSGDTVAVGPIQGINSNRVILYERNAGGPSAFGQVAEIEVPADNQLAMPRLSGDILTIASIEETAGGTPEAGVVRVYHRNAGGPAGWGLTATLDAAELRMQQGVFGYAAEIQGNTLVTMARLSSNALACFVFDQTGPDGSSWTRRKVLPLPGLPLAPLSVRLMGDTLVVGVPALGTEGIRIFGRHAGGSNNWGLVRTIAAPPGTADFGYSMALLGSLLAVSSPDEDLDHDNNTLTPKIAGAGSVRLYARDAGGVDGWGMVQTFSDGLNAETGGRYGEGLAFADGYFFIGRPRGDSQFPTVADSGVVDAVAMNSGVWRGHNLAVHNQNATGWGAAIAVSGSWVLVGAPRYDGPSGVDAGWAFLFRDGLLVKSLLPSGQQSGEQFGYSVAIDGDRLVVGSPFRSGFIGLQNYDNLGAVTLFERNIGGADNWGVVKSFSQPSINNSSASPEFGTSVALQGDVLAVGAPGETALALPGAAVKGRAKIFYRNTGGADNWGQVRSFQGEDNGAEELFGTSVALDGDTLAVGAPLEAVNGLIRSGAVYIHRRNQNGTDLWGRTNKLTQPEVKGDSWFGQAVSLHGDTLAAGSPHEDRSAEPNVGAVYFFERGRNLQDAWTFTRRWQSEEWATEYLGGASVATSHGLALIGIPNPGGTAGRVQLLARHAGGQDQWGLAWEEAGQESFGTAVAMDGQLFAVGEPLAEVVVSNITQTDRGLAAYYQIEGGEFQAVAVRSAGTGAAGMGSSVALHRDWLVVGAPEEDITTDADAGAAYVFHRDRPSPGAWGLVQRLVDVQDNAAGTRFGSSVAVDAQWLMVGVPGAHRIQTYYRQDQATPQGLPWVDSVSLSAGGQPNALGTSLGMENGVLIAGAPLQDVSGNADSGSVYLFERNMAGADSWGLLTPLTPLDPGAGDAFGTSVALSGNRAAIGSPMDNNAEGTDAGAVYLFERNQGGANAWGQALKITESQQTAGDEMGRSVALRDALLLAGLPRADTAGGTDAGRAFLFERNESGAGAWDLVKNFSAPDGTAQARFGTAVAVDRDHAVVGAPFADPRGLPNAGTVYLFSREWTGDEAWAPLQTLAPSNLTSAAAFGAALALDRTTLAFGAPGDAGTGRVHLHVFRGRAFYDEWAGAYGLEGSWALPEVDADGDGQPNLVEMVFGSHPLDGSKLGPITLTTAGGILIVTAHKNEACAVPVAFMAEISPDLSAWTAAGPAQILEDTASRLRIQLPLSPAPRQYVRWRAVLP